MAPPLHRDPHRRMIGGVAAGIAEHLNVDPLLMRLAFVLLAFFHGLGVLLYLIAWVAIPSAPREPQAGASAAGADAGPGGVGAASGPAPHAERSTQGAGGGQRVLGIILIVLGGLLLLDRFSWWRWPRWGSIMSWWPLALIGAGAFMIFGAKHRTKP